jgi:hypothetical protein
MIMGMNELAELHRTPSLNHVSAQSPRVGGCVGTFFHMFDWNPGKKVFTTKRLPAGSSLSSYPTSSHLLLLLLFLFLYDVCLSFSLVQTPNSPTHVWKLPFGSSGSSSSTFVL